MARKNPVLLRRAPLSGRINVLTNYSRGEINGHDTITVRGDGKHDVTTAFYALMLEELMDGKGHAEHEASQPTPDIVAILDGAADGEQLTGVERAQLRSFRERLARIVEDHNARSESGELERA
ncbi:MAG TPA: hypothetical protein VGC32_10215 [Solirubrobacterales bacterium]